MPNVYKSRVKPRHQPADFAQKDVANSEIVVGLLIVQLYKFAIFQKGNFDFCGCRINNKIFFHRLPI